MKRFLVACGLWPVGIEAWDAINAFFPESRERIMFEKGDRVREKSKAQVMTVKGPSALGAVGTSLGVAVAALPQKVVCEWVGPKGKTISRSFDVSNLESAG